MEAAPAFADPIPRGLSSNMVGNLCQPQASERWCRITVNTFVGLAAVIVHRHLDSEDRSPPSAASAIAARQCDECHHSGASQSPPSSTTTMVAGHCRREEDESRVRFSWRICCAKALLHLADEGGKPCRQRRIRHQRSGSIRRRFKVHTVRTPEQ